MTQITTRLFTCWSTSLSSWMKEIASTVVREDSKSRCGLVSSTRGDDAAALSLLVMSTSADVLTVHHQTFNTSFHCLTASILLPICYPTNCIRCCTGWIKITAANKCDGCLWITCTLCCWHVLTSSYPYKPMKLSVCSARWRRPVARGWVVGAVGRTTSIPSAKR